LSAFVSALQIIGQQYTLFPLPLSSFEGIPHLFQSIVDKQGAGLIFSSPIMGQQLRAREKRKRRVRQIRRKEDAAKAASPKAKAKK
jgi:hypothetical protein